MNVTTLMTQAGIPVLQGREDVKYEMYCFWEGEAAFGAVPGVIGTKTGFSSGEVVELTIDPQTLDRRALEAAAGRVGAKPAPPLQRASPRDDLHALQGTAWRLVPMTPAQATRVNAAIASGGDPRLWLSPRQLAAQKLIAADLARSWPVPGPDLRAALEVVLDKR